MEQFVYNAISLKDADGMQKKSVYLDQNSH